MTIATTHPHPFALPGEGLPPGLVEEPARPAPAPRIGVAPVHAAERRDAHAALRRPRY